jgi:hypothetical protein
VANDRGIKVTRDLRTPAEITEERKAGVALDVRVPVLQARWAAFALACVIASSLAAIVALGPVAFWVAAFIVSASAFLWALLLASTWEDGITLLDIGGAFALALLAGFAAWCLAQVATFVGFDLSGFPLWVRKASAVASLVALVFSLAFYVHVEVAFAQELALFRSPFVEKAIGEILTHHGKRWRPPRPQPILVHSNQSRPPEARDVAILEPPAVTGEMAELEAFIVLAAEQGTLSRRALSGMLLPNGERLTEGACRRCVDYLEAAGLVEKARGQEAQWVEGASPMVALAHISHD